MQLHHQEIISFLNTVIPHKTTIVVGVSWWPDSMFLATCLQEYYNQKWREQKYIISAHFNHGQRIASAKEHSFLKKYFQYNTFFRNPQLPKKWLWETTLRDLRHEFFDDVCKQSKSSYLFLWHNLTDRIETTIMNMVRWSSKDGILSIKPIQKKKSYTIYRPILSIQKDTITNICKDNNIPYFEDATNKELITPRNILRNVIVPQIQELHPGWKNNWNLSWIALYKYLETDNFLPSFVTKRDSSIPHPLWKANYWYSTQISNINDDLIMSLFKDSYYATKKTLTTIHNFISNSQGHLHIGWWYIFKVHWIIHCIDGKKDFWKEKYTAKSIISQHWNTIINWYTYDIKKEWLGYTLRYPQSWDVFKKKRLLKTMLNMKIPVFMRNITPLVVDNKSSIVKILVAI